MKLNIFEVPKINVSNLKTKLRTVGMDLIKSVEQDGWTGTFYYSTSPKPGDVSWASTFSPYFADYDIPKNLNYFAVFIFQKDDDCLAISFGKAHFYIRQLCNHDFGIELAKRIANEADIKQTASKRFQGKKKKDIKSYVANTKLAIESGESVDYLQASVIKAKHDKFGENGKFGSSAQLNPDIPITDIGKLMTNVLDELKNKQLFKLPRTTIIGEESELSRLDQKLIDELSKPIGTSDFTHNSYDLYGVDFVFSSHGSYKLWCPKYDDLEISELNIKQLKDYIAQNSINGQDVLGIRITYNEDDKPRYTQGLKETIDYIAEDENIILTGGKWTRFNQDYLDFLDEYLASIEIEEPEEAFKLITATEPDFNTAAAGHGYETADKNFSIFETRSSTVIEAWDLKKDNTVYAVKFGTAQKLGYVCDQAIAVLELLRNKAEVRKVPNFERYCLWLGYRSKNRITSVTDSGSIILKQKIELWARRARELGIEPVIKISQKEKAEFIEDGISV